MVAFCSIIFTFQVAAQAYIYPFPQGVEPSKTYKVTVDRKELFVYNAPVAPVASFDMSGPVNIEIKADRDVKWVDIRPKNLGIHPEFKDSTIRFRLEKPCNISIELKGNLVINLFNCLPILLKKTAAEGEQGSALFRSRKGLYTGNH